MSKPKVIATKGENNIVARIVQNLLVMENTVDIVYGCS